MGRCNPARTLVAILIGLGGFSPALVRAQAAPTGTIQPATEAAGPLLLPRLIIGSGIGRSFDDEGGHPLPLQTLFFQYLAGRHFALGGEFSHWADSWAERRLGYEIRGPQGQVGFSGDFLDSHDQRTWSLGGSLLYRSEPRRVSWFVGGGPLLERGAGTATYVNEGCAAPGFESRCAGSQIYRFDWRETRAAFQGLVGADVQIAGRLHAYADLRVTTMEYALLQLSTGVRIVALTRRAGTEAERRARRFRDAGAAAAATVTSPPAGQATGAAVAGKTVRISLANGIRHQATFVSLTATELAVRQDGRDVAYPLDRVLLVETAHHTARKAAIGAAIVGFFGGWLASCGGGGEDGCWPEYGLLFAGIGAGSGALAGALVDRSNASRHIVYVSPAPSQVVQLAPIVTPRRAGAQVTVRW